MRIIVRANTFTDHGAFTDNYDGDSSELVEWILAIAPQANVERVVEDLFSYGVADSGYTRFRLT